MLIDKALSENKITAITLEAPEYKDTANDEEDASLKADLFEEELRISQ